MIAAADGNAAPRHACATGEHAACLIRLAQKLAHAADRFPGLITLQQLATSQRLALTPKQILQIEDQLIEQVTSVATSGPAQPASPPGHFGDASQLMAWLDTSPTLPSTVSELAAWAGMSVAVLQREFRKTGHTPRVFLHTLRLDRARATLMAPHAATTVADVAHASGMQHLGRFSQYYRERFGELPSETLRRSMQHAATQASGDARTLGVHSS